MNRDPILRAYGKKVRDNTATYLGLRLTPYSRDETISYNAVESVFGNVVVKRHSKSASTILLPLGDFWSHDFLVVNDQSHARCSNLEGKKCKIVLIMAPASAAVLGTIVRCY